MKDVTGKCIICGEKFYKTPDSNYAKTNEGEICGDCCSRIVEKYWETIKETLKKEEVSE